MKTAIMKTTMKTTMKTMMKTMMKDDNGATIQWIEDNPVYALGAWVSPCFPPTALQGKIKDKWLVNMGPPLCALRRLTYSASDRGAVWELG